MINSQVTNLAPSRVFVVPQQLGQTVRSSAPNSPTKNPQNLDDTINIDEEEQKSDKRMMNLCILLLPFILAILFFIASLRLINTSLNTQRTLEGADNVLHFVHSNLNANPITSWLTTEEESCPNDYEESYLGRWQGIDHGCLCKSGNTYSRNSFEECLDVTEDGCSYETGESGEDYSRWVEKKTRFCDRTVPENRWLKVAHCDTTQNTYCGSSVCVTGKNAECPPNSLEVNKKLPTGDNITNGSNVQVSADPKVDLSLYHNSKANPVVDTAFVWMQITQGNTVCLNSDFAQTDNYIYHLDTQQSENKVCDQYGALKSNQVVVLGEAKQTLVNENNGLFDVYSSSNLVDFNPDDYKNNSNTLLAVKKLPVQNSEACNGVFGDHIGDSVFLARHSRTVLRVFSWILFALTIATVILGIVFIAAALSRKVSTQQSTKSKVARIYWFSAWVLVGLAFLIFLYYHIFITLWLGDNEDKLIEIKDRNCFQTNPGINVAISKLINYDEETNNTFGPLVNEMFWYGLVYSLVWMGIIAFWKNKYSEVKSFINNQ